MTILEQAKALGEALANTSEMAELQTAEEAMYNDEGAKKLLEEMDSQQRLAQMAQMQGQDVSAYVQDIQQLQMKMQSNPVIAAYIEKQQAFEDLMQNVNQAISKGMGFDQGCSCDGDCDCDGDHEHGDECCNSGGCC